MVNITNAQLGRRLLRRRCHCALSDSPQRPDDTRPTPTRGKPRAFRSSVARTPSPHVYKFARRPESHRALPSAQPFHARATDVDAHARRVHASRAASHTPAAATATDQCTQNNTRRAKPRTHPDRFRPLPCPRFQVLFDLPFGLLFIVRSHYFFAIGRNAVFSLSGDVPATLRTIPKVRDSKAQQHNEPMTQHGTGLSPSMARCSKATYALAKGHGCYAQKPQFPDLSCCLGLSIWTVPASLAATEGITVVFFSSR